MGSRICCASTWGDVTLRIQHKIASDLNSSCRINPPAPVVAIRRVVINSNEKLQPGMVLRAHKYAAGRPGATGLLERIR
jgi:hypothetical protein